MKKHLINCRQIGVGHDWVLDIKAITADDFARNKTFLDILKNIDI